MRTLLALSTLLAAIGAARCAEPSAPSPGTPPQRLVVMVGGDRHLNLTPFGGLCYKHGGVAREWDTVRAYRPAPAVPFLYLSNGNNFCPAPDLRFEYAPKIEDHLPAAEGMADALKLLGVQAVLVTPRDAWLGLDRLRALEKRTGAPFVCANLIDAVTNKPAFRTHVELDVGGVAVLIVGVASTGRDQYLPKGVRLRDPHDALADVFASLPKNDRFVILLGDEVCLDEPRKDRPPFESIRLSFAKRAECLSDSRRAVTVYPGATSYLAIADVSLRSPGAPLVNEEHRATNRRKMISETHGETVTPLRTVAERFRAGELGSPSAMDDLLGLRFPSAQLAVDAAAELGCELAASVCRTHYSELSESASTDTPAARFVAAWQKQQHQPAFVEGPGPQGYQLVKNAAVHRQFGQWERAIQAWTDALAEKSVWPDEPARVHFDRGLAYAHLNRPEFAAADFARALDIGLNRLDCEYGRAHKKSELPGGETLEGRAEWGIVATVLAQQTAAKPGDTASRFRLGCARMMAGRVTPALADFDAVLAAEPKNTTALFFRAETLSRLGRSSEALAGYFAVLDRLDAGRPLPEGLDRLEGWTHAGVLCERGRKGKRDDWRMAYGLGMYWRAVSPRENPKAPLLAYAAFGDAIRLKPTAFGPRYFRGLLKIDQKEFRDAVTDLAEAVRLAPDHQDAWFQLGAARNALDDDAAAVEAFTQAIRLGRASADVFELRGECLNVLKRYDLALADADRWVQLDKGNVWAWNLRGVVQTNRKEWAAADADLSEAIRLQLAQDPLSNSPTTLLNRGKVSARQGKWAAAIRDFDVAARYTDGGRNRSAWNLLAHAHLASGDLAGYRRVAAELYEALRFKTAWPQDGLDTWAVDSAVWLSCFTPGASKDPAQLIKAAEIGIERLPNDPNILESYGAALLRGGRPADAVYQLRAALKAHGRNKDRSTLNARFFLALALQRAGLANEAKGVLREAVASMDEFLDPEGRNQPDWAELACWRALRTEAEAAVQR